MNKPDVDEMDVTHMIEKYGSTIYKISFAYTKRKADADDVYQDVFVKYFNKKRSFENESHEKAWFIRVTINCCKSLLRSSWFKRIILLGDYSDDIVNYSNCPVSEEHSDLFYAVMNLPVKYREVIHLHYYEGYTAKEIAFILNRTETAITTQLMRGRDLLRKVVKEEFIYE